MLSSSPSRFLNSRVLFEADTGANGGGASGEQSGQSQQSQTQSVADAVKAALADILGAKGGDKDAALETLIRKNHKLEQRAEAAEAKAGQLPPDVQAELDAYRALGKPAEVKSAIDSGSAAVAERDAIKREQGMRAACEAAGIDYADYATRKGVDDWAYEVKDEQKDGKPVKVPYVTFKDADGKDVTKPLSEHAPAVFPTLAKANGQAQQVPTVPVMGVSGVSGISAEMLKQGEAGTRKTTRAAVG